jgi:hypothetical protein
VFDCYEVIKTSEVGLSPPSLITSHVRIVGGIFSFQWLNMKDIATGKGLGEHP